MAIEIPPVGLAIVLCREVVDAGDETTLRGVLWQLLVPSFPARVDRLVAYIAASNVHEQATTTLRVSVGETIVCDGPVLFRGQPRDFSENRFDFSGLVLPRAGEYAFDWLWREEILLSRRLPVGLTRE